MSGKVNWKFTLILCIVGFMLALQYNSMNTPSTRDTRDMWAIRNELAKEKKIHSELLGEIREVDQTLASYTELTNEKTAEALQNTLDKLYKQAGFMPTTGPGFVIEVAPSPESIAFGYEVEPLSSELLTRFINVVNQYKGNELEIDEKRFTTLSWIRDINGKLTVNGENVSTPPFKIKVVSPTIEDSKKLYNHLLSSAIQDEFYLDNLILTISKPVDHITLQSWTGGFENQFLKEQTKEE
ncbi:MULTISPECIES: DUF881 domain-containing protein [Sporosarcina]|uniref:Uncharacterized conserved protein YlxW, UPF0749 family n=1 Tax=Sporosarcina newyorkensis TaxID=759851 RepID=A0A1T4YFC8_9BACL|nr:DUF881 domain-containing protein [Sporosarcina newyorkensis]MBY0222143.1 DUF881 domain-containing protein [Sporosarcina aquimarina]SKB00403.1 Uncharacterized conserved protein YlxW, UPF0749 family [Sporosarcina newyorkensis]